MLRPASASQRTVPRWLRWPAVSGVRLPTLDTGARTTAGSRTRKRSPVEWRSSAARATATLATSSPMGLRRAFTCPYPNPNPNPIPDPNPNPNTNPSPMGPRCAVTCSQYCAWPCPQCGCSLPLLLLLRLHLFPARLQPGSTAAAWCPQYGCRLPPIRLQVASNTVAGAPRGPGARGRPRRLRGSLLAQ